MNKSPTRRRSERIACALPVRWIRRSGTVELVAADMNLHGMFLASDDLSVIPGQLMQLEVTLPEADLQMFVIARFVGKSLTGQGIGVEIFVMEEKQQGLWMAYYRSQSNSRRRSARVAAAAGANR